MTNHIINAICLENGLSRQPWGSGFDYYTNHYRDFWIQVENGELIIEPFDSHQKQYEYESLILNVNDPQLIERARTFINEETRN